ncbi:hypothetical protein RB595_003427 [Gaeumannomyces hyphopodioides]
MTSIGPNTPPVPGPVLGRSVMEWWERYLAAVIGISTFGGSITFSVIVSEIADPARLNPENAEALTPTRFDRETVRHFLAISWAIFICEIGICSVLAMLINFHRDKFVDCFRPDSPNPALRSLVVIGRLRISTRWFLLACALLINSLMTAAFMFLSLAVVAYVGVAGWMGVLFTTAFGLVSLVFGIAEPAVKSFRESRAYRRSWLAHTGG